MEFICQPAGLQGTVNIPGSKSHTIRAVLLASLGDGQSVLHRPLASSDTAAAVRVYGALGAEIDQQEDRWLIRGIGGRLRSPQTELDVMNSGTTMRVALGTCALLPTGTVRLTGDAQIQRRSCGPLVDALNDLGATARSLGPDGAAPFEVAGVLRGGHTSISCKTSQYLTSLLLCCPLADGDSIIDVPLLYERPYVEMTLRWLESLGVKLERDGLEHFEIPGNQTFQAFDRAIPADFSTATFFLAAGALGNNAICSSGLDMGDAQSDKAVVGFLREMGAEIAESAAGIQVRAAQLSGIEADMNDCPDALPMMAVVGCFAKGTTRLLNVPQARMKETDRIAVMCGELRKMGADIEELPDGLVIRESSLRGASVNGHHDHRVVMSLAIAASQAEGETKISTAEASGVTFPEFAQHYCELGGILETRDGG